MDEEKEVLEGAVTGLGKELPAGNVYFPIP